MKRLLLIPIIILLLCLPFHASALGPMMFLSGSGSACGAGSPTLVFWWDCTTLTITNNNCTDSWADESFSVKNGDITIASGYLDTVDSGTNGDDTLQLSDIGTDDFPIGNFTIAFEFYLHSATANPEIVVVDHVADPADYMIIAFRSAAGNDLNLYRRVSGAEDINADFDVNLSVDTIYYIVIRASTTDGPDIWVSTTKWPDVDTGGSWIDGSAPITAWGSADQDNFKVGNDRAEAAVYRIYSMKIYDGWKTY